MKIFDIDPYLSDNELCDTFSSILPSGEWTTGNIIASSEFSDDIKKLINSYTNYSYDTINSALRGGRGQPILNDAIDSLPPLEHDIYVMRQITNRVKLPDQGDFLSKGYLSTSINYASYLKQPRKFTYKSYMKIFVPAGTKALYIPGHERELIFKHNIILTILSHYQRPVVVNGQTYYIDWYDVVMNNTNY